MFRNPCVFRSHSLIIILCLTNFYSYAQTSATLNWAKGIGNEFLSGGTLNVNAIKLDATGNRYVTGYFNGTADFDPGAGTASLTDRGISNILLAKSHDAVTSMFMGLNTNTIRLFSSAQIVSTRHSVHQSSG